MVDQPDEEVAIGADGMLFHRFDWAFEQLCGDMSLSAGQQLRWREHVLARDAFCKARGVTFVTLVVPERHAVYSQNLPSGFSLNPDRPIAQIGRILRAAGYAGLVYPRDTMRAVSRFHRTFHNTDQHMTDDGAYACYWAMVERFPAIFGRNVLRPEEMQRSTGKLVGDLGIRLSTEVEEDTEYLHMPTPKARKVAGARLPVGRIDVYEQPDNDALPKAVWFGDSHSFALLPFVAEHFSRLVIVQTQRFLTDLIEAEAPDFVFSQTSESQIAYPVSAARLDVVRLPDDGGTEGLSELYASGRLHRPAGVFLTVDFVVGGNSGEFCEEGWSEPETTLRWSEGLRSTMLLPVPPSGTRWEISLEAGPFIIPTRVDRQRLTVTCGGHTLGFFDVTSELNATIALDEHVVAAVAEDGRFRLEFLHPDAGSPADYGSSDGRILAMGYRKLSIHS